MNFLTINNIVIISNEPWGDIWYSKHNYANELAKNNCVYWIDPPGKWRFSHLWRRKIQIKKEADNLYLLSYNNILPFSVKYILCFYLNDFFITKALKRFLRKKNIADFLFWSFDPYRLKTPKRIGAEFSIYQVMDDYMPKHEKQICENVDVILYNSSFFNSKLIKYNKPMLYIPHAISAEEFSINKQHPIPEIVRNSFLYVGNIDNRMDFQSLFSLADSFPTEVFCLIGKDKLSESQRNDIKKRNNITILEAVHFKKLKNYIAAAKGCLAIMKTDYNGNMINHHKILQYLAFGKDVYCPAFSEYSDKNTHLLCVYRNTAELLQLFSEKLQNASSKDIQQERIEYAKSLRYEVVLEKIDKFIQENAC